MKVVTVDAVITDQMFIRFNKAVGVRTAETLRVRPDLNDLFRYHSACRDEDQAKRATQSGAVIFRAISLSDLAEAGPTRLGESVARAIANPTMTITEVRHGRVATSFKAIRTNFARNPVRPVSPGERFSFPDADRHAGGPPLSRR